MIKPTFCLTTDQDWAQPWAAEMFLDKYKDIPLHVFRTNPCPVFDSVTIPQGWHPNFYPGSSHGSTYSEVIDYMKNAFPNCETVRTHRFYGDTSVWKLLYKAGIVAASQLITNCQSEIIPIQHCTNIMFYPVFFEDDLFLDLDLAKKRLFTPGLKIFNVHATFISGNIPSFEYYQNNKSRLFNGTKMIYSGRGIGNILDKLIDIILDSGYSFTPFKEIYNDNI